MFLSLFEVVGYLTKDTVAGFNFVAPTFAPIAGGEYSIQDIKLNDGESWADNIQVLDEGGATIATYFYATADESGLEADGWLTSGFDALADVTIDSGKSVIVETASEVSVTFAGKVASAATKLTGGSGFNFVGNACPVAISIQDIKLGDGAESWADNIQILDEGGSTVATYFYATADESGLDADGWLTEGFDALADVTLEPGQGIIVETTNEGVEITIPAAL